MVSVLVARPVLLRSLGAAMVVMAQVLSGRGALRRSVLVVASGGLSGEGEEDLIQGGLAESDVIDLDPGSLDRAQRRPQAVACTADADADAAGCLVHLSAALLEAPEGSGDRGEGVTVVRAHL